MQLGPEVEQAVLSVIRSGMLVQGEVVERLERAFAELIGVGHVVAVNSGTSALIAALRVLDLQPGDEVITSPFTFAATLNAIIESGATARFADIDAHDFNVSPDSVAELVGPRTKVLLPVHLFGQCADMPALSRLAMEADLAIVEDAAQAHGASIGGRCAGTWGIGCFSLYATKNITSGEGGLISTNDPRLADQLRVLRNQGMRRRNEFELPGSNYRLTDLQAALCLPQLASYRDQIAVRRHNADRLGAALSQLPGIRVPRVVEGRGHVWHQYTICVADDSPITREVLASGLRRAGIGCDVYYPRPVFDHACYRDHPQVVASPVAVAADVSSRCLSLPVHPGLTESDLDRIVTTMT